MATTTTNFGWDIPQSTDLVKDGATAIAALGQDIDTAMVDLKGGTTGQVLAKASGTDLDFSWVAQDDSNAIQNAIVDAKGDLIAATANDTPARLAVGTNGQVLIADSAEATGLKWSTASAGALTKITSASFSAVSSVSFPTSTFTSTYKDYVVLVDITNTSATLAVQSRFRTSGTDNSNSNYFSMVGFAGTNQSDITQTNVNIMTWGYVNSGGSATNFAFTLMNPQLTNTTKISGTGMSISSDGVHLVSHYGGHLFNATTSFDSMSLIASTGNFTGRYAVYGLEA